MGLFSGSSAADGKGVTAIASFDNIVTPMLAPRAHYIESLPGYRVHMNDTIPSTPFGWVPGNPPSFKNISLPLKALSNNSGVPADACTPLPDSMLDFSGCAVLIRLGGCEIATKARNVMEHKAEFILFYSDGKQG